MDKGATGTGKVTVLIDHIVDKVYEHFPGGYDVAGIRRTDPGAAERLRETEVLVTGVTPVDSTLIEAMPNLRFVHVFGVGVDKLDLPALWERGVVVSNTLGHNA
ncbi:MAG TPA: hypothetical protein VHL09_06825, partial [Dehalococcoidia bacterium]|nr:hypothetical protein [Dehalococcoidia bacterium]